MNKPPKRLLDQVREKIRLKHYSIRTEQAYVGWIKRFMLESCIKIDENLLSINFHPMASRRLPYVALFRVRNSLTMASP